MRFYENTGLVQGVKTAFTLNLWVRGGALPTWSMKPLAWGKWFMQKADPRVRVTGVLVEDSRVLLVKQDVSTGRSWSLPGGRLEINETIDEGLRREILEETNLTVRVKRLLYVCDRILNDSHVIHISLEIERVSGDISVGAEPEADANPIDDVRMVPIESLPMYGFTERFTDLVRSGFPGAGSYMGSVANIGL